MKCLDLLALQPVKSKRGKVRGTGAKKKTEEYLGMDLSLGRRPLSLPLPTATLGRAGGGQPVRVAWPQEAVGAGVLQGVAEFTCGSFGALTWSEVGAVSESCRRAMREMGNSCSPSLVVSRSWLQLIRVSFLPSSPRFRCPRRRL